MSILNYLKTRVEIMTGLTIYRTLPSGIDVLSDIKKRMPMYQLEVIFDVGANVGQTTETYLKKFPKSTIYCFEPVSDTFRQLKQNMGDKKNVLIYQSAFGAVKGKAQMCVQKGSVMSFLLSSSSKQAESSRLEEVEVDTLDAFCEKHDISKIDYLKIDTEGGDLDVLSGSKKMLDNHRIDFVEVEAGMNTENKRHVHFLRLNECLVGSGYFLFGIYEQTHEWPKNQPQLRRSNLVYIARSAIERWG